MERTGFIRADTAVLAVKEIRVNELDNTHPTLIFLHEGLGSIGQWKEFPNLLSKATGLNAIVFDRQGYGKSAPFERKRNKDYLHLEALEVLPELIKKLKIAKPLLVGHSDGATIALLYASAFEPLAIICASAHIFVEEASLKGIREAVMIKDVLIPKLRKYHGAKTRAMFSAWADTWLDPGFKDWKVKNELKGIKCPVLLIQGEDDEYASREHPQLIKEMIGSNAEAVIIKNSGHSPHLSATSKTVKLIVEFIKNLPES